MLEHLVQVIGKKTVCDSLQQLNQEREIEHELPGMWNVDGGRRLRGRIG